MRASRLLRSREGGQSWRRASRRPRVGILRPRSQCCTAPLVEFIRRDKPSWLNSRRRRTLRTIFPVFNTAMIPFLSTIRLHASWRSGLNSDPQRRDSFRLAARSAGAGSVGTRTTTPHGDAGKVQADLRVTREFCTFFAPLSIPEKILFPQPGKESNHDTFTKASTFHPSPIDIFKPADHILS